MNVDDRGLLVGMVLGDGHLSVRKRLKEGKYEYVSSELTVKHSAAQRDYCLHKAALVRSIFGGNFTVIDRVVRAGGKDHYQVQFNKSNAYFKTLKSLMYPNGVKTYTRQVLDMLTPHGIAIWYMDDGNARVNISERTGFVSSISTNIATMCSEEELVVIQDYFRAKHDIEFKGRFNKTCKKFLIEANTENSQKFARLVMPYVIPSMLYKLAHVANLNTQECKAPVMTCISCGNPTFKANRMKGLCSACYTRLKRREQQVMI